MAIHCFGWMAPSISPQSAPGREAFHIAFSIKAGRCQSVRRRARTL